MAATVESSHFPLGVPVNDPSFARAVCISEMRLASGAFCPFTRRLEARVDFAWCDFAPGLEEGDLEVFGVL
jgi:hypothetical protein